MHNVLRYYRSCAQFIPCRNILRQLQIYPWSNVSALDHLSFVEVKIMAGLFNAGIRARVVGKISGQDCIQVLHFGVLVPWNVDTITVNNRLKELANAIHDCIVSTLLPAVCNNYTYQFTECAAIFPNQSDFVPNDAVAPDVGQLGEQGVLVGAQLVEVKTGTGGRRGRGRNFWPPSAEINATGGEWNPAALVLIAAFCACMAGKFMEPNPTTDFRFGVYSTTIDNQIGSDFADAFTPAIALVPSPVIATMGTRKLNRGS
jgi:hypothetical protein